MRSWVPAVLVAVLLFVPGAAVLSVGLLVGASASADTTSCGPGGTATQVGDVTLSAEQLANAQTITATIAAAGAPQYAAVVALATAMQESTLHNSTTQTDHDSEGLFQQRVSVYGVQVATNPVLSTQAFLVRLLAVPDWQTIPLTQAAQAVQISNTPDAYATWQTLAAGLATRFWTGPVQGTGSVTLPDPVSGGAPGGATTTPVSVPCSTAGDAGGAAVTGAGVPAGYTLPTDPTLAAVVGYALAQLGKPYVWAAAGPDSFDCSGLVMAAWSAGGVALPRTTYSQVTAGVPVPSAGLMTPGDLIFIPGSDGTVAHPGHVGLYIGAVNGTQYLVQAPETGDVVKVSTVTSWGPLAAIRHIPLPTQGAGT